MIVGDLSTGDPITTSSMHEYIWSMLHIILYMCTRSIYSDYTNLMSRSHRFIYTGFKGGAGG